ncbi:MAG: hypothetical protein GY821_12775 [Gammaproteobacteria bacterium]|nr:hypothetical protein [Gammaproteobacteria bacterium]
MEDLTYYTIEEIDKHGNVVKDFTIVGSEEASEIASDWEVVEEGNQVYVSWYRASDGCQGYLNSCEENEVTGESWV